MTPYQLKRSILTAAIQGKITKQDENEGTGAELLAANTVEKKHRIAEEKVKAGKPCRPITEDDTLFDIPSNWSWARFGDLVLNFDSRRRPVTKEDRKTTKGLYDYYGATGAIDRVDEYIFDGEFLMIGEDGGNFFVDRDNSFIANGRFWANNHVHVVQPVKCEIWYLKHCLDAYNMPNMGLINGIAVPKLNQENLNSIMIPVPPLAEQKRIVAKIEELLPLIDRYEQAWSKLEEFNKRFPVDMQKSILQMAIQGKLVPQLPEEGTGEELYGAILASKKKILGGKKEGKLSSETIKEDELLFDIPESWKWVRFGHIMINRDAERIPLSVDERSKLSKVYDYYGASGVIDKVDGYLFDKKLLLIGEDGANLLTRSTPIAFLATGKYWVNNHAHVLDCDENLLHMEYIMWFINAINLAPYVTGTAQPKMNQQKMNSIPIALPPLAEQKRIVAKLEEILPMCERLK